jgi:hypothetical protein
MLKQRYRGVKKGWKGRWLANGYASGKAVYLGTFDTAEQAAIAVDDHLMATSGNHMKLNFPERYPAPLDRECRRCRLRKPLADFLAGPRSKHLCRECRRAIYRKRHSGTENGLPPIYIPRSLEMYARLVVSKVKNRARGACIVCTITTEDVLTLITRQQNRCAISGIPMTYERGAGRLWTNLSIDRIDSTAGYTPQNIQLACAGANRARLSLSMPEFVEFCRKVVRYHLGY